jgi:hypothetical protein
MPGVPAFVQNGRLDLLAANALATALYADAFEQAVRTPGGQAAPNGARFTFLDERAVELYPDYDKVAADTVAALRAEAGRSPTDRRLNALLGELSHSERFSTLWARQDVRWHTNGTKRFRHPVVGDLTLAWEGLELSGDPGQTLVAFTAGPGSTSAEAVGFLASWASGVLPDAEAPRELRSPR